MNRISSPFVLQSQQLLPSSTQFDDPCKRYAQLRLGLLGITYG
jgi:hypothetical protein